PIDGIDGSFPSGPLEETGEVGQALLRVFLEGVSKTFPRELIDRRNNEGRLGTAVPSRIWLELFGARLRRTDDI
ncbi:MAG TPA: hypothetical protein VIY51_22820, partial [Xanthobacteraceae bacterium]